MRPRKTVSLSSILGRFLFVSGIWQFQDFSLRTRGRYGNFPLGGVLIVGASLRGRPISAYPVSQPRKGADGGTPLQLDTTFRSSTLQNKRTQLADQIQ